MRLRACCKRNGREDGTLSVPTESAATIVLSPDRLKVLLVKREDFRIWGLPGGGIEPGESAEHTAVRETCEESGYIVEIDRLIGHYWTPQARHGGNRMHLFEAHVVGGAPLKSGPETREVCFFRVDKLPGPKLTWVSVFVADCLANSPNCIERMLHLPVWQFILIRVGLVLRDVRNKYLFHR